MKKNNIFDGKHLVYALGGGCFCYGDIPREFRAPSVFRGAGFSANNQIPKKFLPQILFDGTMRSIMLDNCKQEHWYAQVIPTYSPDTLTYDVSVQHIGTGLYYGHFNLMDITKKDYLESDEWFGFFDKNKYNMIYVMDMTRAGFDIYGQQHLLSFEDFLVGNGYDLHNFVYCDFEDGNLERYEKCRICLAIMPKDETAVRDDKGTQSVVKAFFARHYQFIKDRIEDLAL